MKEVAQAAKCSVMTVSLALRDSREVSEATKIRIKALCKEMGYRPNPLVSALISQRKGPHGAETLAVLSKFDKPITQWKEPEPFYSDLYRGIVDRAEELGFRVEEFPVWGPERLTGDRLTRILSTRGIRGVVLFPGGGLDRNFPELDWKRFAVVASAFHAKSMAVHRTSSNYAWAMEETLRQAQLRGYRRIGLAMNSRRDPATRYALSGGYLSWQVVQSARDRVPLIKGDSPAIKFEEFAQWVTRHKPDLVLGLELPVDKWLSRMGLKDPDAIGCTFLALRGATGVAGIDQRSYDVGRTTVTVLARELFLNHYGLPEIPEVTLINGVWREGRTIRKVSALVEES
jgi:LacI family transcriptional regulator